MINKVILMGRLTADPELKQTQSGVSVAIFQLAVERNYAPQGQNRQADFIPCVAWRQTAEFIRGYFDKGRMIAVEGSLQSRNYEDKAGNKRTAYEVIVDHAYFAGSKPQQDGQRQERKSDSLPAWADMQIPGGMAPYADEDDLPY